MDQIDRILQCYREGKLALMTAEALLAELITPENVDAAMTQMPSEIIDKWSQWNFDEPIMVMGSNMTPEWREKALARLAVAAPTLKDWFARHAAASIAPPSAPVVHHESVNP
jgi:hypothetical protein